MFKFQPLLRAHLQESTDYIRSLSDLKPQLGLILGSGFGAFAEKGLEEIHQSIPFKDIPHFLSTGVEGHEGKCVLGKIQNTPVAILQGRLHTYEGHTMQQVVFPLHTLISLGINTLLCTNAAGGLDEEMSPGDFMIIKDHINLMGDNPLRGSKWEEPFPDMSQAYNRKLIQKMIQSFQEGRIPFHEGTYCGMQGPCYETPAEIQFLRQINVKAVGMSTVPEIICAHHRGIPCAALSCITNLASGLSSHTLNHREVMETMEGSLHQFIDFVSRFVQLIYRDSPHSPKKQKQ